jgi:hypothetical protein
MKRYSPRPWMSRSPRITPNEDWAIAVRAPCALPSSREVPTGHNLNCSKCLGALCETSQGQSNCFVTRRTVRKYSTIEDVKL